MKPSPPVDSVKWQWALPAVSCRYSLCVVSLYNISFFSVIISVTHYALPVFTNLTNNWFEGYLYNKRCLNDD